MFKFNCLVNCIFDKNTVGILEELAVLNCKGFQDIQDQPLYLPHHAVDSPHDKSKVLANVGERTIYACAMCCNKHKQRHASFDIIPWLFIHVFNVFLVGARSTS